MEQLKNPLTTKLNVSYSWEELDDDMMEHFPRGTETF